VELDLLDDDVDPEPRAGSCSGLIAPFNYRGRARAPGHAAGSGAVLLATRILIALTIGVAAYGVETDRKGVVMAGLAATAVVAAAMAVSARELIRTGERSCRLLHRALAESERAQYELDAANETLQRSNTDLRALQLAVVQGFALIDERSQGRLRELIEDVGDEFAALVDEALDRSAEGAS